jgi:hypothetical protein
VLVGHHLLLRDLEPYGITLINVCASITTIIVMTLRSFGPYEITFTNVWFTTSDFTVILDGQLTSNFRTIYGSEHKEVHSREAEELLTTETINLKR